MDKEKISRYVNNEDEIIRSPCNLQYLQTQFTDLMNDGFHVQAGRILKIIKKVVDEMDKKISEAFDDKYIVITDKPEKYNGNAKFHAVIPYLSDKDFMSVRIPIVMLYIKQPEIKGIIVENTAMFENLSVMLSIVEVAAHENKHAVFNNDPFIYDQLKKAYGSLIDIYKYGALDFPSEINFITAVGNCNLKCKMCPQSENSYKKEVVDFEIFKKAIQGIPNDNNIKLNLTPMAEPFLIPDMTRMVRYAHEKLSQTYILLNTNGVPLTEKIAEELVQTQLSRLLFSLNMHTREDYKWFTGMDMYEKVCENIKMMRRIRDRMSSKYPKIWVQMMKIPKNKKYSQEFDERWSQYADFVFFRGISNWGGIVDIKNDLFKYKSEPSFLRTESPCISLWMSLTIDWHGDIWTCCSAPFMDNADDLKLGNLNDNTLGDIWKGKKLHEIRFKQMLNMQKECVGCSHYKETEEYDSLLLAENLLLNVYHSKNDYQRRRRLGCCRRQHVCVPGKEPGSID